jgi:integrase
MRTTIPSVGSAKTPWNKGRLIGQKRPLKPKEVWAIRVRLQLGGRKRDLALFNLAIDSKLRGCDLVVLQVDDVCAGSRVRDRGTVIQKKTGRPVQFEITEQTRSSIRDWLSEADLRNGRYLFPSRFHAQPHLSTRQYARIVHTWVESAGLDSSAYGTHSMRRTKVAQIYRKTGNLRAVQLLLGHTKLESLLEEAARSPNHRGRMAGSPPPGKCAAAGSSQGGGDQPSRARWSCRGNCPIPDPRPLVGL